MAKISIKTHALSYKHRACLSTFVSEFVSKLSSAHLSQLGSLIDEFPKKWPFPKGDLHSWIPVLDRFDHVLQSFISIYQLHDGPQTQPFGDRLLTAAGGPPPSLIERHETEPDRIIVQKILEFSRLLLENCGNRGLYSSGEHLTNLLNTTSLELLNATLHVSLCLAQRYHASANRTRQYLRGSSPGFVMTSSIERFVFLAAYYPELDSLPQANALGSSHASRTGEIASLVKDLDLSLLALEQPLPDGLLDVPLQLRFSFHQGSGIDGQNPGSPLQQDGTQSSNRMAPPDLDQLPGQHGGIDQNSQDVSALPASTSNPGLAGRILDSPESQIQMLSIELGELTKVPLNKLIARYQHRIPKHNRDRFLLSVRSAQAFIGSPSKRHLLMISKLLSLTILTYVLSESEFEQKVLRNDSDLPRRKQLAYQLVDLIRPPVKPQADATLQTHTLAAIALQALLRQRRRSSDITAALTTHNNHGVLLALLQTVLDQDYADLPAPLALLWYRWQEAVFALLSKLVTQLDRVADGMISAGSFPLMCSVLQQPSDTNEWALAPLLSFLDHLIYSPRNGFQLFAQEGGLEVLTVLTSAQVERAESIGLRTPFPLAYRSMTADFSIPYTQQRILCSVLKIISDAFAHSGHGHDRLLRNLADSQTLLGSIHGIVRKPKVFGSATWSLAVNVMLNLIHHEPISYTAIADAGLVDAFINCLRPANSKISTAGSLHGTTSPVPENNGVTKQVEPDGNRTLGLDLDLCDVPLGCDAIMAAAQAFGAVCLNANGLELIESSGSLARFMLIFTSDAHVQSMSLDTGFGYRLGSTFNELLRHYPTLQNHMLEAIVNAVHAICKLLTAQDPTDTGDQHEIDCERSAANLRPAGLGRDLLLINEQADYPFVEQLCHFLKGFLNHPGHSANFIKSGGVEGLLDICDSPGFPANKRRSLPSYSISHLLCNLADQKPHLVLPSVLSRLASAADSLVPLLKEESQHALGTKSEMTADARRHQSKKLTAALIRVKMLSGLFGLHPQHLEYDRRPREPAMSQVNVIDFCKRLLPSIADVLRLSWSVSDDIKQHSSNSGAKDAASEVGNGLAIHDLASDPAGVLTNGANDGVPSEGQIPLSTRPGNVAHGTSPDYRDSGVAGKDERGPLTDLLSDASQALVIFLQHLTRNVIGKRQTDPSVRYVANQVAEEVGRLLVMRLAASQDGLVSVADGRYRSLAETLTLTEAILFDSSKFIVSEGELPQLTLVARTPKQVVTSVLRALDEQGGISLLCKMLSVCWGRFEQLSTRAEMEPQTQSDEPNDRDSPTESVRSLLELLGQIVSSRSVIDAPQTSELVSRTQDRSHHEFFRPTVFLVQLRIQVAAAIIGMWRSDAVGRAPSSITEKLLPVVKALVNGEGENGAYAPSSHATTKSTTPLSEPIFQPNAELLTQLNAGNNMEELNKEALFRCYNVYSNAKDYVDARRASSTPLPRYPPPSEEAPEFSRKSQSLHIQRHANGRISLHGSIATIPVGRHPPGSSSDQYLPEIVESSRRGLDEAESTMEYVPTPDNQDVNELLDMGADFESLLNGLSAPQGMIAGADVRRASPGDSAVSRVDSGNEVPAQPPHVRLQASMHKIRSEFMADTMDRCITILGDHTDLTFEMGDFLRDVIILKNASMESNQGLCEELALTLVQSLLSLHDEDDRLLSLQSGRISAIAHLIAILLQTPRFAEQALGILQQDADDLLDLLRPSRDGSSQWLAYVLLILERMCSECYLPVKMDRNSLAEQVESGKTINPLPVSSILPATRMKILKRVMALLPSGLEVSNLPLQILRVVAVLSRDPQIVTEMTGRQHLENIFSAIKYMARKPSEAVFSMSMLILRHVVEDERILSLLMRTEIRELVNGRQSTRSSLDFAQYLKVASHLALRSPEAFLSATFELMHIPRIDGGPNLPMRNPQIALKVSEPAPTDSVAAHPSAMHGAMLTNDNVGDQTGPLRPGMGTIYAVVQFMLQELITLRDEGDGDESEAKRMSIEAVERSPASTQTAVKTSNAQPDPSPSSMYRCFLLAGLTELLASYHTVKVAFLAFSRKNSTSEMVLSTKPRSGLLNYLLNDLLPPSSIQHVEHEDLAAVVKKTASKWTMNVIVALCAGSGDGNLTSSGSSTSIPEDVELLTMRRFVLDHVQKAYKDPGKPGQAGFRYARMLILSDLISNLLEHSAAASGGNSTESVNDASRRQLAQIMYEKGFVQMLTDSLSELNHGFPSIKRVVKYVLKAIKILTGDVHDLGQFSDPRRTASADAEETTSVSSLSESDTPREETPDLFRHSALGIIDPPQNELSSSLSGDDEEEEEEEEMFGEEFERELDYNASIDQGAILDNGDDDDDDDDDEEEEEDDDQTSSHTGDHEMSSECSEDSEGVTHIHQAHSPLVLREDEPSDVDSSGDEEGEDEEDELEEDVDMLELNEHGEWHPETADPGSEILGATIDSSSQDEVPFDQVDVGPIGHDLAASIAHTSFMDSIQDTFGQILGMDHDHDEHAAFSDQDEPHLDEEQYSGLDEQEELEYDEEAMDDEADEEHEFYMAQPGNLILPPQPVIFDPDEDFGPDHTRHRHFAHHPSAHGSRHPQSGHPWYALGAADSAGRYHPRTNNQTRRNGTDGVNPLLQPSQTSSSPLHQTTDNRTMSTGSTDFSRLLSTLLSEQEFGRAGHAGHVLDQLLTQMRDGSGFTLNHHNGTLHLSMNGDSIAAREEVRALLGRSPSGTTRTPSARAPLTPFTPLATMPRWQEDARLLVGNGPPEIARRLENILLARLVPAARRQEEERKKKEEEDRLRAEVERERFDREVAETKAREAQQLPVNENERITSNEQTQNSIPSGEAITQTSQEPMRTSGESRQSQNAPTRDTGEGRNDQERPATGDVMRVLTNLRGQELDITGLEIDPSFLDALPEEMREEVLMQQIAERRQREAVTGQEPTEINREFLNALPADIREEVLRTEAQERRRQERAAQQSSNEAQQREAVEMDPASFLASLQPELRQTVLAEGDDDFINQLPPELAAEAQALRRPRRMANAINTYVPTSVDRSGAIRHHATLRRQDSLRSSAIRLFDQRGTAAIVQLLFLPREWHQSTTLRQILSNACLNRQDRHEVLGLLTSVLFGISSDARSAERTRRRLTARSLAAENHDEGTAQVFTAAALTEPDFYLIIATQCLHSLLGLVHDNVRVPAFFLTEHETHLCLSPEGKKGKGRAAKALRYPVNMILGLLARDAIAESNGAMEILSSLIALITNPLRTLSSRPQQTLVTAAGDAAGVSAAPTTYQPAENPAPAVSADGSILSIAMNVSGGSSQPVLDSPIRDAVEQNVTTNYETAGPETKPQSKTEGSDEPRATKKGSSPPVIPDANLRLIVGVLAGAECSSHTFKQTLQAMESLLAVPQAAETFGAELVSQAKLLAVRTMTSLDGMLVELKRPLVENEPQIFRFPTASLDQTKLLRVLTALDFLFEPKKQAVIQQKSPDYQPASYPNLVGPLFELAEFSQLWCRLGDCLAVIAEKRDSQSLATILLPLIEALMIVCKNTAIDRSASQPLASARSAASSPPPDRQMEHLFYTFTEDHRKLLNSLVRSNPRLMSGSFALLVKNPKVLEFDNKRNYFNRQMHHRASDVRQNYHSLSLNVRRDHVFLDTYKSMYFKSAEEIKYAKLNVRFSGEDGVDAGGVTREWFSALSRQMFNPDYALFLPVAGDRTTFHPNNLSSINEEHLLYFKFIGRIIGKALYEGKVLDCHFSRAVYRRILGKAVSIKDMESIDLDYYRSLLWILQNPIADIITETFSLESENFGVSTVIELVPNGRNLPVTEENKQEYVRLVTENRLTGSVKEQLEQFLVGFHDIVPPELIAIFNEQELELLISGLPEIDVEDWKANTEYHSYSASSPQVQWFWRAVRSFDKEEKAKLLQFITGTSRVPLNGFKELEGMHGFSRFNIHRDPTSRDRLPSSHTCFNQLDLPEYEDYDSLRRNLLLAFTAGGEYFGFA